MIRLDPENLRPIRVPGFMAWTMLYSTACHRLELARI